MITSRIRRARHSALVLSLLAACSSSEGSPGKETPALPDGGETHPIPSDPLEFVSAEGRAGQASNSNGTKDAGSAPASAEADNASGSSSARTVEEGDIYRLLGAGKLLNLNPYRGLQVVDMADVTKPKVIGRMRESGQPVELYVIGQRAVVLLNNWTGYWGSRSDVRVEQRTGGLVLSVDLTDPTSPKVTDREFVPGNILTSRLTREGERSALYVAAQQYECTAEAKSTGRGCQQTVVKSIDTSTADLLPRTTLNLGGYVAALQATPTSLIVARTEYDAFSRGDQGPTSQVSLVDISNIDGQMVEGAQVKVRGQVQTKFNLDLRGGVLRVVSGTQWGRAVENHLETFDAKSPNALAPIAHCTFGAGQNLFGTLFLEDRAFFVTYLRQDPFHAFALDASGRCEERSEFVVSGWNDFFKPVFGDRRLIGIGKNDQQGQNVAVSLYDITDLDNASPLLARKEVDAAGSWSQANYDDKAFSVIEGAVSVAAGDAPDVLETGVVLLPFQSWGSAQGQSRAGVQIYTFSERTITRRGFMDQGEPVSRSFQSDSQVTVNLSSESLSLFDTSSPDAPVQRGRVELAPSYNDVHDFGSHLVRVRDTRGLYGSWWGQDAEPPPSYLEVIADDADPDAALPLASVPIPAGSRTVKVGTLLVVITTNTQYNGDWRTATHRSVLRVYDFATPTTPALLSTVETDRLLPAYGYGWGRGSYYPMGCGVIDGGYYDDFSRVLPNALVLGRNVHEPESIGEHESCSTYLESPDPCQWSDETNCAWDTGYESCLRKVGTDQTTCEGGFKHCVRTDGKVTCSDIEKPTQARKSCYTSEHFRSWQSMQLDVLDLRDSRAPKLVAVPFAREEESQGLVAAGQSVYFAFKRPHTVGGDPRPFAKYYFREVNLVDPALPVVSEPVNVPGQLLAVSGTRLFARDLRWGASVAETWLHVLERVAGGARLVGSQAFTGRDVTGVLLDGGARVFVTHRALANEYIYDPSSERALDTFGIFAADTLAPLGKTEVDTWSDMTQAVDGRVLFSVPGGLMIVNAQTPSAPYAQAYFPHVGYMRQVSYDGQSILFAAGPYGLHRVDATTHNLLPR